MTDENPCQVLIVEDDVDSAEAIRDVLIAGGRSVELAHTVDDGLRALAELRPEVVLCDVHLPDQPGFELAAAVRGDPELAHTVLIAMSGLTGRHDRKRAIDRGFDAFLPKPLSTSALERALACFQDRTLR